MNPSVSIIMPCYNAAAYLSQSIASVQSQTISDWELIAVDDGSSDGTLAWLKTQTDPRLRVHTQTNQGVSAARNAGLKLVRGQFVAFLDADDTWAPNFLEKMLAALKAKPDAVLAYCGWRNVGLTGPRGEPFIPPDYETPAKRETLFAGCRWPIHAALIRCGPLQEIDGFDARLKNAEDYALWLELACRGPIIRVPEALAFYHFHGGSQASSNLARSALHHLSAQLEYLQRYPEFSQELGRTETRHIVYGQLLKRGFECYWSRHLKDARTIFHAVMKAGYGSLKDWLYMLPSLLPTPIYINLIRLIDKPGSISSSADN